MGGAVSSGKDNDDLIDNLLEASYIKTPMVERVFRAVDRGDYFLPPSRGNAYKDLAWKNGNLHISAPCIYSKVMEGLELRPGLSFLNLGSGTGYLSTMVGLVLGSSGLNHGIELHQDVVTYANHKLADFKRLSGAIDEYDFCEPQFMQGNCLCLMNNGHRLYDRVYCGAACPVEYADFMKSLLKVGGILVMPLNDKLLQIRRISDNSWEQDSLLPVTFATLIMPSPSQPPCLLDTFEVNPHTLQYLCRTLIRNVLRKNVETQHCPLRRVLPSRNKAPKEKPKVLNYIMPIRRPGEWGVERRDRSRGRVILESIESESLMNFMLGTLHGTRREFLRSQRRVHGSRQQPTADEESGEGTKAEGEKSTQMEVDQEEGEEQDLEAGDRKTAGESNGKWQDRNSQVSAGTSQASHSGLQDNDGNNDCDRMDEDEFVDASNMLEDYDQDAGNVLKNITNGSNNNSNNNDIRDDAASGPFRENDGGNLFSIFNVPTNIVVGGMVIRNIQSQNPIDDSVNEADQNNFESRRDSSTSDNSRVNNDTDDESKAKTDAKPTSKNHEIITTADINTTEKRSFKESLARSSSRSSSEACDVEILCDNCDKASGEEKPSSSKQQPSKPRNSNRKKSDSGLGDEIIKSDLLNSSSDEAGDHYFKFATDSLSSDTEDCDDDDDKERYGYENRNPKRRARSSTRWSTDIELHAENSLSSNSSSNSSSSSSSSSDGSSDGEGEECKMEDAGHRMYESPYTVHMTCNIQLLPLPIMLKNFLNYNRDF